MREKNNQPKINTCECGGKFSVRESPCAKCAEEYLANLAKSEAGLKILRDFYDENETVKFVVK